MTKPFYQSWTLWANGAVILGLLAQVYAQQYVLDPGLQTLLLALANVLLRLKTSSKLTLTSDQSSPPATN